MGGAIDGRRSDHLLPAPPFIVASDEIALIVERTGAAIDAAAAEVTA